MKRLYFLIISILFITQINAQLKLGVIGAPQYDRQRWISNNNLYEHSTRGKIKFEIGVILDIPVADNWSIQPELLYSRSSTTHVTDYDLAIQSNLYNLGYAKMPVCLTYLLPFPKSHIYFGAGPYASNLVLNNYTFYQNDVNLGSGKLRIGKSYDDQITAWDFGLRLKAGIHFKKGFMFGAYYDKGMKDVNPQSVRTFNNSAGVNFAYFFNLSRNDKYNRYPDYYNY
jgi:outer membrane immunogenic protein